MTLQDQERARVATEAIYVLGSGIIGVSSPLFDERATTRALINQESYAALVDTLSEQGNSFKPDKFDAYLAARLEALRAQLQAIASGANPPVHPADDAPPEDAPPEVGTFKRFPPPPPPPPGQLPNPYISKFPLETPDLPTATQLPAIPEAGQLPTLPEVTPYEEPPTDTEAPPPTDTGTDGG